MDLYAAVQNNMVTHGTWPRSTTLRDLVVFALIQIEQTFRLTERTKSVVITAQSELPPYLWHQPMHVLTSKHGTRGFTLAAAYDAGSDTLYILARDALRATLEARPRS